MACNEIRNYREMTKRLGTMLSEILSEFYSLNELGNECFDYSQKNADAKMYCAQLHECTSEIEQTLDIIWQISTSIYQELEYTMSVAEPPHK